MAYTKYSLTPANNTAAPPDGAPEGMLPSAVNDTMRDMMAQIRDVGDGIRGGTYTMTAPVITGGSITGVALSGNTFTSPVITGGSINNTPIGATTANTGAFTTLGATGVATFSAGTVSAPAITTTGDTNTGIFFPAADTIAFTEGGAESMRIDSSGNLGIGTATASNRLTVAESGGATQRFVDTASGVFNLIQNGSNGDFTISADHGNTGASTNIIFKSDGATERMRIDSSGNVGIGTSSPSSFGKFAVVGGVSAFANSQPDGTLGTCVAFQLSGFNTEFQNLIRSSVSSSISSSILAFNLCNGSNSTTEVMRIQGGNVGIGTSSPTITLDVFGSGMRVKDSTRTVLLSNNISGGVSGIGTETNTNFMFITNNAERMRITPQGAVCIGATATSGDARFYLEQNLSNNQVCRIVASNTSTPYGVLVNYSGAAPNGTSNEFFICSDTGATRAAIRSNGGLANYSANNVNLSDAREKTNIELAGNYLDKICSIPVKTFNYIDQNLEEDDGLTLGVVAQDVQAVAPELVMESNWASKNEPEKMRLSIYQTDLQYALMKAIQELKAELDSVKAELQTLKGN
jgi:hypothetical protein